jgi:hypothetical protein
MISIPPFNFYSCVIVENTAGSRCLPLAIFGKLSLRMSHVLHMWLVTIFGVHGMFEGDTFLLRYEGNKVNIDMICWIFAPLVGRKKRLP